MDPKGSSPMLLAPPARSSTALSFPSSEPAPDRFPPVDEHLVTPELTRDELIRGRKVVASPALEPHGDLHADMDFLIRPHVREGYRTSVDLLTRVSEGSNFATDLSIRKEGLDPATGRRFLEELSFEIVNEQSLRDVREKAEDLVERGVRRVFGIFVERGQVSEWSREKGTFVPLAMDGTLDDPCFVRPIAIRALLDAAIAEGEVIHALEKKGHPDLAAMKERAKRDGRLEGQLQGQLQGQRRVLQRLLCIRFGELPTHAQARLDSADSETLDRWAERILSATSLDELFGRE